jgi:thiol-disulfide isomerase/thioredoxin
MKTTLAALTLACLVMLPPSAFAAKAGEQVPKLTELLPGSKLPDIRGKVVLVDFWASWCAPCKASFPALNRLHEKYAAKGLVIIGVGVDDDAAKYKEFTTEMKAKFSVVHDSSHKAAAFFNPPSMPTSYLTDRKGVIRHVHKGFRGAKTEAEYVAEIEALLAEK